MSTALANSFPPSELCLHSPRRSFVPPLQIHFLSYVIESFIECTLGHFLEYFLELCVLKYTHKYTLEYTIKNFLEYFLKLKFLK